MVDCPNSRQYIKRKFDLFTVNVVRIYYNRIGEKKAFYLNGRFTFIFLCSIRYIRIPFYLQFLLHVFIYNVGFLRATEQKKTTKKYLYFFNNRKHKWKNNAGPN